MTFSRSCTGTQEMDAMQSIYWKEEVESRFAGSMSSDFRGKMRQRGIVRGMQVS